MKCDICGARSVHFCGEPDRFSRTLDLMPKVLTAKVRWSDRVDKKFRISRLSIRLREWFNKHGRAA